MQSKRARTDVGLPQIETTKRVDFVESRDGTRICYTTYGEGPRVLVLSPGLATPPIVYDYLIAAFGRDIRIITWDMRGTFRSQVPRAGLSALRVEDSADDLEAIVHREGLERFVLGGWSMGVQVALEYHHRTPGPVLGLLLINGGSGNVLRYVTMPGAGLILPQLLRVFRRLGRVVSPIAYYALARRPILRALVAVSVVTNNAPFFYKVVDQFRTLDFGLYAGMLHQLHRHSAEAYLEGIQVPTVLTAGTRDFMTPVHTAKRMAKRIDGAHLHVVENGTHYSLIEYPEAINRAASELLSQTFPEHFEAR